MPESYVRYWDAWQRQLPDVEFRTWVEKDVATLPLAGPLLSRTTSPVRQADIARYDILLQEGGVYLDCDVMPLAYPSFFNADELVTCNENEADDIRSIGFLEAPAGHPTFRQALELIAATTLGRAPPNVETGPVLFRKAITSERRLPSQTFYPYHHSEPFSRIFSRDLTKTFGIHVWGRSWLSEEALTTAAARCFHAGDIEEAEALLVRRAAPIGTDRALRLLELCRYIRSVRLSLMQGLRGSAFRMALRRGWIGGLKLEGGARPTLVNASRNVPGLFEVGWHLLSRYPQTVVWQVGACDGILADPLRPLLVNFDPTAVLIEAHPELYIRLQANYRRNDHITFVNAAVGREVRTTELIAVDPDAIAREGLPDWALGLSSLHQDRNALGGKTVTDAMHARLLAATRRIRVEVETPAELRRRTGIAWPDMLVVDAEGCDAEVVTAFLDARVAPKVIYFETICLPAVEIEDLKRRLVLTHLAIELPQNMMFVRYDVVDEVIETAFVEQGRLLLPAFLGLDVMLPGMAAPSATVTD